MSTNIKVGITIMSTHGEEHFSHDYRTTIPMGLTTRISAYKYGDEGEIAAYCADTSPEEVVEEIIARCQRIVGNFETELRAFVNRKEQYP